MYYHQSVFKYWLIDINKYIHTHVYFFNHPNSTQLNCVITFLCNLCHTFSLSVLQYEHLHHVAKYSGHLKAELLQLYILGRVKQKKELLDCSLNVSCFHKMRIVPGKRVKNCDSWYKSVTYHFTSKHDIWVPVLIRFESTQTSFSYAISYPSYFLELRCEIFMGQHYFHDELILLLLWCIASPNNDNRKTIYQVCKILRIIQNCMKYFFEVN